jgi:hypothetical protein
MPLENREQAAAGRPRVVVRPGLVAHEVATPEDRAVRVDEVALEDQELLHAGVIVRES